jgi:hypothetical protein
MLRAIETGKGLAHRHTDEAAVVAVAPAMIGARNGCRAGSGAVEQARAAVPADVMERLDVPVLLAQHEDAFGSEIECFVIAWPRDRVLVTNDLPARQEHPLDFEGREGRMAVHPGGEGVFQRERFVVELGGGQTGHDVLPHDYMVI